MLRWTLSLCLMVGLTALAPSAPALAKGGGQVFISMKPFPKNAKSESSAKAAAKKQSAKRVTPTDPEATKDWEYVLKLFAFFGKALDETTIEVKLYDITDDTMRLVTTFEQYLAARGQRSYQSELRFRHPDQDVRPNREYLLVVGSRRGGKIAETRFTATGKVPKLSGKVTFEEGEGN